MSLNKSFSVALYVNAVGSCSASVFVTLSWKCLKIRKFLCVSSNEWKENRYPPVPQNHNPQNLMNILSWPKLRPHWEKPRYKVPSSFTAAKSAIRSNITGQELSGVFKHHCLSHGLYCHEMLDREQSHSHASKKDRYYPKSKKAHSSGWLAEMTYVLVLRKRCLWKTEKSYCGTTWCGKYLVF